MTTFLIIMFIIAFLLLVCTGEESGIPVCLALLGLIVVVNYPWHALGLLCISAVVMTPIVLLHSLLRR